MKRIDFSRMFCIMSLTLLSSCSRYIDWGKQTFLQAESTTAPAPIAPYLKSIRVYDDFCTVLLADALWLTMPVRQTFVDMRTCRQAYNEAFSADFLNKQRETHAQHASFYIILGPTPDKVPVISKTDSHARWAVSLCVDGTTYTPHELKPIELEPEYQYFLRTINQTHREIFLVTFDVKIKDDQPVTLNFRSIKHEASCAWNQ